MKWKSIKILNHTLHEHERAKVAPDRKATRIPSLQLCNWLIDRQEELKANFADIFLSYIQTQHNGVNAEISLKSEKAKFVPVLAK